MVAFGPIPPIGFYLIDDLTDLIDLIDLIRRVYEDAGNADQSGVGPCQFCSQCQYETDRGELAVADEIVRVRHDVELYRRLDGSLRPASRSRHNKKIEISVSCANQPHVLQFVHRVETDGTGNLLHRRNDTTSGMHDTTTDLNRPNWHVDALPGTRPFYDATSKSCRDSQELTIWDEPTFRVPAGESHAANFHAFIYCGGEIVREVVWSRSYSRPLSGKQRPRYTSEIRIPSSRTLPQWAIEALEAGGFQVPYRQTNHSNENNTGAR